MKHLRLPTIDDAEKARQRISNYINRTPLLKLNMDIDDCEIYLKLENLQPIGAFKIRPAFNGILSLSDDQLKKGVYTISSGNMAFGLAWAANKLSVPMVAYVYEGAPDIKLQGIRNQNGEVRFLPEDQWERCIFLKDALEATETMVHPVMENSVLAGNGTIAIEIIEDLPDVDAVLIPYGGGAATIGIGSIIKELKPDTRIVAIEATHATPLTQTLACGKPVRVDYQSTFVKSIGAVTVYDEILEFAKVIVDDVMITSVELIAEAIRVIYLRNKIIAEGAAAAPLAAALSNKSLKGKVVCIVSGGNVDMKEYAQILNGELP